MRKVVHRDFVPTPSDYQVALIIELETFDPFELGRDWLLLLELNLNVVAFGVDRRRQQGIILALVVELKDENSLVSSRYHQVLLVVELHEVDQPDLFHLDRRFDDVVKFIHEDELEVARDNAVQLNLISETQLTLYLCE